MKTKEYEKMIIEAGYQATPELVAAVEASHKATANAELVDVEFQRIHAERLNIKPKHKNEK